MIHVPLAPEPASFDQDVRKPGLRAIAELAGESPEPPRKHGRPFKKVAQTRDAIASSDFPTYWTKAIPYMMDCYRRVCAYSCFEIHPITGASSVDHMAPKSRHWAKVYEWDNYRLACGRMNARKNKFEDVIDPCDAIDDWFHLELVGFQVIPNPALSGAELVAVEDSIARLGLGEQDLCDIRAEHARDYWDGHVSFEYLQRKSPFLARELKRQGRLI